MYDLIRKKNSKTLSKDASFKKIKHFKRRDVVSFAGQISKSMFYVRSGMLKLYRADSNGNQIIISIAKEGDFVAYYSFISHEPEISTSECMEDSELLEINYEDLVDEVTNNKILLHKILESACFSLKEVSISILNMSQCSIRSRTANVFIMLMNKFEIKEGDEFPFRIRVSEIAGLVGAAYESVIRTLAELKNEKIVKKTLLKYTVLNYGKLIQIGNRR